jgi:hypothetical protein
LIQGAVINIVQNPMEKYQNQNKLETSEQSEDKSKNDQERTKYDFTQFSKRLSKVEEYIEDDSDEDVWDWVPFKTPSTQDLFTSSRAYSLHSHHPAPSYRLPPPSYHPPPPSYHPPPKPKVHNYAPPQPPLYKAVYEVDFTPIFLSLLPVFLVLGTLLGLALTGITSGSTVYLTDTSSSSSPSVAVNVTSSSTSTATAVANTTSPTTSFFPLFIFPNGTLAFSFIPNFAGLINFGGFIIGRGLSAENTFFATIMNFWISILGGFTDYCAMQEDDDSDYVIMEEAAYSYNNYI